MLLSIIMSNSPLLQVTLHYYRLLSIIVSNSTLLQVTHF